MSYASDLGLTVGSKIKIIDSNPHSPKDMYNHNDILLFVEDTGDKCSKFRNLTTGDDNCWFTFQDRTNCTITWEHYKEEEKAMTFELKAGDKVEVINTGIFRKDMVKVGDVATYDGCYFSCPTWDDTQYCSKDFWSKYLKPYVAAKIKFPCCVPMSEIKDQDTFDKIFALFIASGAEKYETDWEDNDDYYKYFGVDYDKDTVFYSCVESYSFNDEEDEVVVYSVAELLGQVPKEEAEPYEYKVGDLVEITDCKYGHEFDIGEVVRLTSLDMGTSWRAYKLDGSDHWQIEPEEFTLSKSIEPPKVKTTPLVSIVKDVTYTVTIKGIDFWLTRDELNELSLELDGFEDYE